MKKTNFSLLSLFNVLILIIYYQTLYETQGLSFLMDDQDTVQAYEEQGKASGENGQPSSRYEQGLKALSSLDRIKQVEAIEGRKMTLLF